MANKIADIANGFIRNSTNKPPPLVYSRSSLVSAIESAGKTPPKVWIWRLVILILCISLLGFIFWFQINPESYSYSNGIGKSPSERRLNGLYYWCTLTSTVGFGDICPITPNAKGVTSLYQIFITLLSLGVLWNLTDDKIKQLVPVKKP
jgi:hypothetical protein